MSQRETWPGEGLPVEDEVEELDPEEVEEDDDLDEPGLPDDADEKQADDEDTGDEPALRIAGQHAAGELDVPDDIDPLEGEARDARRRVGIVVSRVYGGIVYRLLAAG